MIKLSTCGPQTLWAPVDNSDPTLIPTLGLGQLLQPRGECWPSVRMSSTFSSVLQMPQSQTNSAFSGGPLILPRAHIPWLVLRRQVTRHACYAICTTRPSRAGDCG